jgi:hypothetical protein
MAQCMRHAPLDIFTPSCLDMHGEYILALLEEEGKVGSDVGSINWDAIDIAKKKADLNLQWFMTKHSAGMCGVGKFLQIWGQQESAACPRFWVFDFASHVWCCPVESARTIREKRLKSLEKWLKDRDMGPSLTKTILGGLSYWISPGHLPDLDLEEDEVIYHQNEEIG